MCAAIPGFGTWFQPPKPPIFVPPEEPLQKESLYISFSEAQYRRCSMGQLDRTSSCKCRRVADAIVKAADTLFGKRPLSRADDPTRTEQMVNMVSDRVRAEMLCRIVLTNVLTPRDLAAHPKNALPNILSRPPKRQQPGARILLFRTPQMLAVAFLCPRWSGLFAKPCGSCFACCGLSALRALAI
jgi:hypothetical protein